MSDATIFVNADIGGRLASLRVVDARIESLDVDPRPGDRVVDLHGDRLLPGLINAHDHLKLNGFPRLKYRPGYVNASEWIADVDAHVRTDTMLQAQKGIPRESQLLQGALRNLLSGVTTVAHHDPMHEIMLRETYPVRVVTAFGWSHSLAVDGERRVTESHRSTPSDHPWIIHAAEGIDDVAHEEFERLVALGCVGPNTLLVHGVALDREQRARLVDAGAALVWCPSSNLYLYGATADVARLAEQGRVALGSDSRLSGERDLLVEIAVAAEHSGLDEPLLEAMVTTAGARLLRLQDRGTLEVGKLADLLILPKRLALSRAARSDVRLVTIGGRARYGDEEYVGAMQSPDEWSRVCVDGACKALSQDLASLVATHTIREAGFDMSRMTGRAA